MTDYELHFIERAAWRAWWENRWQGMGRRDYTEVEFGSRGTLYRIVGRTRYRVGGKQRKRIRPS